MKKTALKVSALIIVLGLVVIMFMVSNLLSVPVEVKNEKQIVEVEKEVVVKELEARIKEAQNTAKNAIETKAQKAYDDAYGQAMKEVELEIVSAYKKEVEAIETSLSKEVGAY